MVILGNYVNFSSLFTLAEDIMVVLLACKSGNALFWGSKSLNFDYRLEEGAPLRTLVKRARRISVVAENEDPPGWKSGHPRGERRGNCPLRVNFSFNRRFKTQRELRPVAHHDALLSFRQNQPK